MTPILAAACSRSGLRAPGQGKSGGFRTLVATNNGGRWIFLFGFPKNERSNIDKDEEEALKKLAAHLLSLTQQAISQAERAGELHGKEQLDAQRRSTPILDARATITAKGLAQGPA